MQKVTYQKQVKVGEAQFTPPHTYTMQCPQCIQIKNKKCIKSKNILKTKNALKSRQEYKRLKLKLPILHKTNYPRTTRLVLGNNTRNLMCKICMHKGKCTLCSSNNGPKSEYHTQGTSCVPPYLKLLNYTIGVI